MNVESNIPNPERKIANLILHNVTHLEPDEFSTLHEKIEAAHGNVFMLVHPFFDNKDANDEAEFKEIAQFIRSILKTKMPLIIMEDHQQLLSTNARIAELLEDEKNLYLVPTYPNAATPMFSANETKKLNMHKEKGNFRRLNQILSSLGTKKIILGGRNLIIKLNGHPIFQFTVKFSFYKNYMEQRKQNGANFTNYLPRQCVGITAAFLSQQFPVVISKFTYPHNHKNLKEIENLQGNPQEAMVELVEKWLSLDPHSNF